MEGERCRRQHRLHSQQLREGERVVGTTEIRVSPWHHLKSSFEPNFLISHQLVRRRHVPPARRIAAETERQGRLLRRPQVIDERPLHALASHQSSAVAREALSHQAECARRVLS